MVWLKKLELASSADQGQWKRLKKKNVLPSFEAKPAKLKNTDTNATQDLCDQLWTEETNKFRRYKEIFINVTVHCLGAFAHLHSVMVLHIF